MVTAILKVVEMMHLNTAKKIPPIWEKIGFCEKKPLIR
jgi:hypothetical protein